MDFLEKELTAIKPEKSGGAAQDPPLVLALDDYFTLTPLTDKDKKGNETDPATGKSTPVWRDNYLDGWGAVYDILAALAKHEYSLDAHLEANPPDGWQWRRDNRAFECCSIWPIPRAAIPCTTGCFPSQQRKTCWKSMPRRCRTRTIISKNSTSPTSGPAKTRGTFCQHFDRHGYDLIVATTTSTCERTNTTKSPPTPMLPPSASPYHASVA